MNTAEKLRCIYTYIKQEQENAEIIMNLIKEEQKLLWNGIKNGIIDFARINRISAKSEELRQTSERLRDYSEEAKAIAKQIYAEEQIRMNFRKG